MKVVQDWILFKRGWEGVCLFPQSGAMTLEKLIWLEYNIVPKLQIMFNLGILPKIRITSKKASSESCSKLNSVWKSIRALMSYLPREQSYRSQKIDMVVIWYLNCKLHSFRAPCCQNYTLFQEKLQMKVVQNWISYKQVCKEFRIDFSISVWSIKRNRISENCKNQFFETRFNRSSKNQLKIDITN